MPTRLNKILQWVIPVLLVVSAIGYSYSRRFEIAFWDGAIGNWLATLLGIVFGVPVALHLERKRNITERTRRHQSDQTTKENVLVLLKAELILAKDKVSERVGLFDSLPIEPLKTASWDAIKATGNLRYVAEIPLLNALSDAYRLVEILAGIERWSLNAHYGINVQFPDGENASMKLLRNAQEFHVPVLTALTEAISMVEKYLNTVTIDMATNKHQ